MMISSPAKLLLMTGLSLLILSCGSNRSDSELREYIAAVKARPPGPIESIPTFLPYEAFVYSATALRSPFDRPVEERKRLIAEGSSDVKPDLSREKEFLESFDLESLNMVGTLERDGTLWALISDKSGGIHRVATGNYLGQNFGRIVATTRTQIEIIEIVSNGLGGWVERPRTLKISEKE